MNKKIILIIIFLVSVLLVTVAVAGVHEKPAHKGKKASPTPSVSISPYTMPLPIMNGSVKSSVSVPANITC